MAQPSTPPSSKLYFAYGSNLHLTQMATRCPASAFVGKGVLHGWKWHINERGYANVVKSSSSSTDRVEGLLYTITPSDEARLDLSEGVAFGCYEKEMLSVSVVVSEEAGGCSTAVVARRVAEGRIAEGARVVTSHTDFGASTHGTSADDDEGGVAPESQDAPLEEASPREEERTALVYASSRFVQDGQIQEEYIGRMRKAVADALALGVSEEFIKTHMAPHLYPDQDTASTEGM